MLKCLPHLGTIRTQSNSVEKIKLWKGKYCLSHFDNSLLENSESVYSTWPIYFKRLVWSNHNFCAEPKVHCAARPFCPHFICKTSKTVLRNHTVVWLLLEPSEKKRYSQISKHIPPYDHVANFKKRVLLYLFLFLLRTTTTSITVCFTGDA